MERDTPSSDSIVRKLVLNVDTESSLAALLRLDEASAMDTTVLLFDKLAESDADVVESVVDALLDGGADQNLGVCAGTLGSWRCLCRMLLSDASTEAKCGMLHLLQDAASVCTQAEHPIDAAHGSEGARPWLWALWNDATDMCIWFVSFLLLISTNGTPHSVRHATASLCTTLATSCFAPGTALPSHALIITHYIACLINGPGLVNSTKLYAARKLFVGAKPDPTGLKNVPLLVAHTKDELLGCLLAGLGEIQRTDVAVSVDGDTPEVGDETTHLLQSFREVFAVYQETCADVVMCVAATLYRLFPQGKTLRDELLRWLEHVRQVFAMGPAAAREASHVPQAAREATTTMLAYKDWLLPVLSALARHAPAIAALFPCGGALIACMALPVPRGMATDQAAAHIQDYMQVFSASGELPPQVAAVALALPRVPRESMPFPSPSTIDAARRTHTHAPSQSGVLLWNL